MFRIRSYVIRGRRTAAQAQAWRLVWPHVGLSIESGLIDYAAVFGRIAPRFLEIGFGVGASLLGLAKAQPEHDFIGIETHHPGIGAISVGIREHQLTNLRLYQQDAVDVLMHSIPPSSLDGVQIFFPDPWPKRRHHARRLVQPSFIELVASRMKPGGFLHLATDWPDYAEHMMQVLTSEQALCNLAGPCQFATARSPHRPVLTKFEQRAMREGRSVHELAFLKKRLIDAGCRPG